MTGVDELKLVGAIAEADGNDNAFETVEWAVRRITELEDALRAVVRDVNDYEEVNKLHPNPGRTECWDSVARAKKLLSD